MEYAKRALRAEVLAEDDIRVEDGNQGVEIPAGRAQERIDDDALPAHVRVRAGQFRLTRRRARLASCLVASGERSTSGAISSNGSSNMSWRTKASRSAGVQGIEDDEQRQADRVRSRLFLRLALTLRADDGVGQVLFEEASRRRFRVRSMLRQIRATIVVNQPPRLSTSSAFARLTRIHASCSASSASLSSPASDRPQTAAAVVLLRSGLPASRLSFIGHVLSVRGVNGVTPLIRLVTRGHRILMNELADWSKAEATAYAAKPGTCPRGVPGDLEVRPNDQTSALGSGRQGEA